MWVLGTKLRSWTRAVPDLNFGAISPGLGSTLILAYSGQIYLFLIMLSYALNYASVACFYRP